MLTNLLVTDSGANLADFNSDSVRRWVESNPLPTLQDSAKAGFRTNNINNNTIDFNHQTFWTKHSPPPNKEETMPMLLQQPPSSHMILSPHEADQPLDFTMSKFKTSSATVASQIKQFNNMQHMMLLQNNGLYFNRSNNNKSFTRGSSPTSSSSEEEGVGPPESSPRSQPASPLKPKIEGKSTIKFEPRKASINSNNTCYRMNLIKVN